jgi:predicted permease
MSGQTYLAYDYPLLSVFWSMLWLFLWIMWFVLLFRVVVDIFRDDDMSGWAKAGWLVFTILLPFLGVFVYVIARGKNMGRREVAQARPAVSTNSPDCPRSAPAATSRTTSSAARRNWS